MIESGFDPVAVSRAGAKGLWQFMAPTARLYGLRVDRWTDERLDPEKSTRAAARLSEGPLRDLRLLAPRPGGLQRRRRPHQPGHPEPEDHELLAAHARDSISPRRRRTSWRRSRRPVVIVREPGALRLLGHAGARRSATRPSASPAARELDRACRRGQPGDRADLKRSTGAAPRPDAARRSLRAEGAPSGDADKVRVALEREEAKTGASPPAAGRPRWRVSARRSPTASTWSRPRTRWAESPSATECRWPRSAAGTSSPRRRGFAPATACALPWRGR